MSIADDVKQWRQKSPFRKLREDLGTDRPLSIRDTALTLGITEGAWRGWEEGRYAPTPDKLARLQEIAENEKHCRAAADYKAKPLAARIEEWKKKTPRF